jgi:uncharacterized RDD family membrane protein YckC
MKTDLVAANGYRAYRLVVHHDQSEDFTVYRPAGFVLRWYALTLDLTLAAPLSVLIHLPFNRYLERQTAYGHDAARTGVAMFLTLLPLALCFVGPTLVSGQTLGKKIVGIRVIAADGSGELRLGAVILRETVGKLLSLALFGAGFFMVATSSQKRGLHDRLSRTRVIAFRD